MKISFSILMLSVILLPQYSFAEGAAQPASASAAGPSGDVTGKGPAQGDGDCAKESNQGSVDRTAGNSGDGDKATGATAGSSK